MRPVNRAYSGILLFGSKSAGKEVEVLLFSFESGSFKLKLSEPGFLQRNNITREGRDGVNIGKAGIPIVGNEGMGGRDKFIEPPSMNVGPQSRLTGIVRKVRQGDVGRLKKVMGAGAVHGVILVRRLRRNMCSHGPSQRWPRGRARRGRFT